MRPRGQLPILIRPVQADRTVASTREFESYAAQALVPSLVERADHDLRARGAPTGERAPGGAPSALRDVKPQLRLLARVKLRLVVPEPQPASRTCLGGQVAGRDRPAPLVLAAPASPLVTALDPAFAPP
jgi:hypothetical protein